MAPTHSPAVEQTPSTRSLRPSSLRPGDSRRPALGVGGLAGHAKVRWGPPDEFFALVSDRVAGHRMSLREVVSGWQIGSGTALDDGGGPQVPQGLCFEVRIYLTTLGDLLGSCDCRPLRRGVGSDRQDGIWGRHFASLEEVEAWLAEVRDALDGASGPAALERASASALHRAHAMLARLEREAERPPPPDATRPPPPADAVAAWRLWPRLTGTRGDPL